MAALAGKLGVALREGERNMAMVERHTFSHAPGHRLHHVEGRAMVIGVTLRAVRLAFGVKPAAASELLRDLVVAGQATGVQTRRRVTGSAGVEGGSDLRVRASQCPRRGLANQQGGGKREQTDEPDQDRCVPHPTMPPKRIAT
jgi:hypothetical protein